MKFQRLFILSLVTMVCLVIMGCLETESGAKYSFYSVALVPFVSALVFCFLGECKKKPNNKEDDNK